MVPTSVATPSRIDPRLERFRRKLLIQSFMATAFRQAFFPHTIKKDKDSKSEKLIIVALTQKKKLTFGALTTPPLFFTLLLTAGRVVFV
jgi:hypothetical protein